MKLIGHVNKSAAAAFFGVTTQSLDRWFTAGCPVAKRGSSGAITELDLSDMAQWRIDRAPEIKEPVTGTLKMRQLKKFTCEFLVPCLANDFLADAKRIAELAHVPEKAARDVWGIWTIVNYESLQRLFDDPAIAIKHTELTTLELKAQGDRERKRAEKSNKKTKRSL